MVLMGPLVLPTPLVMVLAGDDDAPGRTCNHSRIRSSHLRKRALPSAACPVSGPVPSAGHSPLLQWMWTVVFLLRVYFRKALPRAGLLRVYSLGMRRSPHFLRLCLRLSVRVLHPPYPLRQTDALRGCFFSFDSPMVSFEIPAARASPIGIFGSQGQRDKEQLQ